MHIIILFLSLIKTLTTTPLRNNISSLKMSSPAIYRLLHKKVRKYYHSLHLMPTLFLIASI